MPASYLRLTVALAIAACASEPASPPRPSVSISGLVTHEEAPLSGATVQLRVWDSLGNLPLRVDSAVTNSGGRFSVLLEFDTVVTYAVLDGFVTPPFGSGLQNVYFTGLPTFDQTGRADTVLSFPIERAEPPISGGPAVPLDPARLVGLYDGHTVPPYSMIGGAYLTLDIDSVSTARPFGRFQIWFDASTGCGYGSGENLIDGVLGTDTLHLRLLAGVSPSIPQPKVQDFVVTSHDALNDTLILHYPRDGGGDCPWGNPAPLRLVRQAEP